MHSSELGLARVALFALLASFFCVPSPAATCFVKPGASSGADGSSWAKAAALQSALAMPACTEIWVAAGVYKPTASADRSISFSIASGTAIYGGFTGTETERGERVPGAHPSILSGDIDSNDTSTAGVDMSTADIVGNNSYHVVLVDGHSVPVLPNTVLDGFTITGGKASGDQHGGGGLYCFGAVALAIQSQCSPTLSNLVFSGNLADGAGGALVNEGSYGGNASPVLNNVTFRNNAAISTSGAGASGGAMFSEGGPSGKACPTLINVTFSGNVAFSSGNPSDGGAMSSEGTGASCSPVLRNVTFHGNSADYGGAMSNYSLSALKTEIFDTIFWGDASTDGLELYESYDSVLPTPSIISHSVVAGGCPPTSQCDAVYTGDPGLGPLQDNGGFTPTIAIDPHGSAIDHGGADCPATDQRGISRPQGAACDIGAYEYSSDDLFASGFDDA